MTNFILNRRSGNGAESQALILMKADQRLDISGMLIPISLVLCKSTLTHMTAGKVLEICLSDREILQDLLIIIERAGDDVLAWEKQDDCYYLWVRKSPDNLSNNQSA